MAGFLDRRGTPSPVARRGSPEPSILTIPDKTTIVGTVDHEGAVQVDGLVRGDITAEAVVLSRYGTVAGTIVAATVDVSGGVSGAIFAEKLVLKAGCDVEGEICYRELVLEDGSYFEGKSRPNQRPLDIAPASSIGEVRPGGRKG
jgi:cytoskeletal protein CcmA (bactofilin family)